MFTSNPFAELSASIPPVVMQTYVVVMMILVALGTLIDVWHKKSARYFFDNWRSAREKGPRQVGGGEMASLAIQTAATQAAMAQHLVLGDLQRRLDSVKHA